MDPNTGEGETGSSLGLNSQPSWHMRGSTWTVRDSMADGSLGNETEGYPPHTSTHHMHLRMHIENRGERDRREGGEKGGGREGEEEGVGEKERDPQGKEHFVPRWPLYLLRMLNSGPAPAL